jgi:hypothetical protein
MQLVLADIAEHNVIKTSMVGFILIAGFGLYLINTMKKLLSGIDKIKKQVITISISCSLSSFTRR